MGRALAPVEQAVGQWKQFISARQANERLGRLFDSVLDETDRLEQPPAKGALSLEGVSTVVPGTREPLLKGISFNIDAGTVLAVIGPSGSGKSTLARVLVGVTGAAAGAVRLDGTELSHWDPDQLGGSIGYLAQEVKLFSGTVAENIARFATDATDEEIIAAAQLAGAHEMIQGLREGYATEIGDGGAQLSGGQRQRIGLARAVFRTPSLIVLDEPNSNLDSEGENALAECLLALKALGKTVVVITHKANLLSTSDKTLMLSNGAVQKMLATKDLLKPKQPEAAPQQAAAKVTNIGA